jgi:hypothetical protein
MTGDVARARPLTPPMPPQAGLHGRHHRCCRYAPTTSGAATPAAHSYTTSRDTTLPPPAPPLPRGAGTDSHGPMDRANRRLTSMVNVSLPRDPSTRIGSGRPTACDVKNAEGTRNPQESWRICERGTFPGAPGGPARRRIRLGPCEPPQFACPDAGRTTEGTQEPQESRGIRDGGGKTNPALYAPKRTRSPARSWRRGGGLTVAASGAAPNEAALRSAGASPYSVVR